LLGLFYLLLGKVDGVERLGVFDGEMGLAQLRFI
jgi:hypothetical protein